MVLLKSFNLVLILSTNFIFPLDLAHQILLISKQEVLGEVRQMRQLERGK
jgi:hypothetical protein